MKRDSANNVARALVRAVSRLPGYGPVPGFSTPAALRSTIPGVARSGDTARTSAYATVLLFGALSAFGQSALEQRAKATESAWMALSRGLDGKLARLLPCDPAVAPSIQEVSTASQARLSALTAYYQALAEIAAADVIAARKIRDGEQSRLNSIPSERTDTEQERSGIASQLRNLTVSARTKPVLAAAERQLTELEAMTRERATLAGKQSAEGPGLAEVLNRWITNLEGREAGAKQLVAATQAEGPLWERYYTARQARARTECTVTGGGR